MHKSIILLHPEFEQKIEEMPNSIQSQIYRKIEKWSDSGVETYLKEFIKVRTDKHYIIGKNVTSFFSSNEIKDNKVFILLSIQPVVQSKLNTDLVSGKTNLNEINRLSTLLSENDIKQLYELKKNINIEEKKEFDGANAWWLQSLDWSFSGELGFVIVESREWANKIEFVFQNNLLIVIATINDVVNKISISNFQNFEIVSKNVYKYVKKFQDSSALDHEIYFAHYKRGEDNYVILLDIEKKGKPPSIFIKEEIGSNADFDNIASFCNSTYPYDLLVNDDNTPPSDEEKSNWVLSQEEHRFFENINEKSKSAFPLFLNGRAGSGKTTLLYYLYAQYATKKIKEKKYGSILYLTFNEELLSKSREATYSILKSKFSKESLKDSEIKNTVDESFKTFKHFLLDLLPHEKILKYQKQNRVSYDKFKQDFYNIKNIREAKKYSSEKCWYIINNYIKGFDEDQDLTPLLFEEKIDNQEDITLDDYKNIYDRIYLPYLNFLKQNNKWDDQDLTREILKGLKTKEIEIKKEYFAIFCDETQDFTRLQIRLLLKISAYNKFNLRKTILPIHNLPFVLAGDPLQTISPTGFNWKKIVAIFYEEIKNNYNITEDTIRLIVNQKKIIDLKFNYRSDKEIVRLSNNLLFLKSLKDSSIKAQKTWNIKEKTFPKCYTLKTTIEIDVFFKTIKDSIIIVPLENESPDDFISTDELFKRAINQSIPIPKNIFTSIGCKGLEFGTVIIYKFGHYFKDNMEDYINNPQSSNREIDYYLNRLYVAMTRAERNLIIVDTEEGFKNLWNKIGKDNLKKIQDFEIWKDDCGQITPIDKITELKENDPVKNADKLFISGLQKQNIEFLTKAKDIYEQHSNDKHKECKAYISKFKEEYKIAAEEFKNLNELEQAKDCYWIGEYWEELYDLLESNESIKDKNYFVSISKINVLLNESKAESVEEGIAILKILGDFPIRIKDTDQFRNTMLRFFSFVMDFHNVEKEKLEIIAQCIIDEPLLERFQTNAIQIYYRIEKFEKVVELSDSNIKYTNTKIYFSSKAKLESYPNNLIFLDKAEHYSEIVRQFLNNKEAQLESVESFKIVSKACKADNNLVLAFLTLLKIPIGELNQNEKEFVNTIGFKHDYDFELESYIETHPDNFEKFIRHAIKEKVYYFLDYINQSNADNVLNNFYIKKTISIISDESNKIDKTLEAISAENLKALEIFKNNAIARIKLLNDDLALKKISALYERLQPENLKKFNYYRDLLDKLDDYQINVFNDFIKSRYLHFAFILERDNEVKIKELERLKDEEWQIPYIDDPFPKFDSSDRVYKERQKKLKSKEYNLLLNCSNLSQDHYTKLLKGHLKNLNVNISESYDKNLDTIVWQGFDESKEGKNLFENRLRELVNNKVDVKIFLADRTFSGAVNLVNITYYNDCIETIKRLKLQYPQYSTEVKSDDELLKQIKNFIESPELSLTGKIERSFKVTKLKLSEIGIFQDIEIFFDNSCTIFIGYNGTGKTTILRSIALGLLGVEEKYQDKIKNLWKINSYPRSEIILTVENSEKKTFKNQIIFSKDNKSEDYKFDYQLGYQTFDPKDNQMLILGFSQQRGTVINLEKQSELNEVALPNRRDLEPLIFNSSENTLHSFFSWVANISNDIRNGQKDKQKLIDTAFGIFSRITQDEISFMRIEKVDPLEVWIRTKESLSGIPHHLTSQGCQTMMGWIGYLIERMYEAYPQSDNFIKEPVLVLIDELDSFLHPFWQQKLLRVLREEFINMQIIASTHSPIIIDGLESNQAIKLEFDESERQMKLEYNRVNIWAYDYSDIYEKFFKTNWQPLYESGYILEQINEIKSKNKLTDDDKLKLENLKVILDKLAESKAETDEIEKLKHRLMDKENELIHLIKKYTK